jgi:uncharacterized RDD family membrane protein YckC
MEEIILDQEVKPVRYAGFWLRFVASIIDYIVLYIAQTIIMVPLMGVLGLTVFNAQSMTEAQQMGAVGALIGIFMVTFLFITILQWMYYALMESYNGATLGKMALGLKVTDMDGNKISFLRASGRYFGKIVSSIILLIGYIMAGLTEKKQALHDIMANCLVVKK